MCVCVCVRVGMLVLEYLDWKPYSFFFQDDDEFAESALDGLKQVMTVKSRVVLPYLVPQVNNNLK